MENLKITTEDGELVIRAKLNAPGLPSKSGKSTVIATTRGNVIVGNCVVGVNVYRRNAR